MKFQKIRSVKPSALRRGQRLIALASERPRLTVLMVIATSVVLLSLAGRNRYASESEFIIVGSDVRANSQISSGLQGSIFNNIPTTSLSVDEGNKVQVYLRSPQVYKKAFEPMLIAGSYSKSWRDPFAGISDKSSIESKLDYFRKQFIGYTDQSTGIVKLRTYGLDPASSKLLNERMSRLALDYLQNGDREVKDYNIKYATEQVKSASERLYKAMDSLASFRQRTGQLDEQTELSTTTGYIAGLQKQLVDLRVDLSNVESTFKDSNAPELVQARGRVEALKGAIKKELERLKSEGDKGLAADSLEAKRLAAKVVFETENVQLAMGSLNRAREDGVRAQRFMLVLSDSILPTTPDNTWRYKLFLGSATVIVVAFALKSFIEE